MAGLLLCLWLLGCSKSEVGPGAVDTDEGVTAHYTLLLSDGSSYVPAQFTANALAIEPSTAGNMVPEPFDAPEISYRNDSDLCFYRTLADCSGEVRYIGLSTGNVSVKKVFGDSPSCGREIMALASSASTAYLGYNMPGGGIKETLYLIRAVSLASASSVFPETEIEYAPYQLLWSNNRLYVLAYDGAGDTYFLYKLNGETGAIQQELDLGSGVQRLLATNGGKLLVSYEQRHLLLDPLNLEVLSRIVYTDGKEPNIGQSPNFYFDPEDRLYYAMPTGLAGTAYDHIPAVYDLANHIAYLYYYENFLNENQLNTYYAIGDTRVVGFDHHNGFLLIGYQKAGSSGGGLLRIKPVPDPRLIDHIALDGIPMQIHVE
jgi:hypothetical protein